MLFPPNIICVDWGRGDSSTPPPSRSQLLEVSRELTFSPIVQLYPNLKYNALLCLSLSQMPESGMNPIFPNFAKLYCLSLKIQHFFFQNVSLCMLRTKSFKILSFRHSVNRLWIDKTVKYHLKTWPGFFRQY